MPRRIDLTDEEAEIVTDALHAYAKEQPVATVGVGTRRKTAALDLVARIRTA